MARVWRQKDAPKEMEQTSSAKRRQRREKEKYMIEVVFEALQDLKIQIGSQATLLEEINNRVRSSDAASCEVNSGRWEGGVWTCLSDTTYFVEVPRIQYVEKVIEIPKFVVDQGCRKENQQTQWEPLGETAFFTTAKQGKFDVVSEADSYDVVAVANGSCSSKSVAGAFGPCVARDDIRLQDVVKHGKGENVSIGFYSIATGDRLRLPFKSQEPVTFVLDEFCTLRGIDRNTVRFQIWGEELSGEETWNQLQRKHQLDAGDSIDVVTIA